MQFHSSRVTPVVLLMLLAVLPASPQAARHPAGQPSAPGEFFIISSLDPGKKELLLKRPTEVTELMQVSDSTHYFDTDKKPIKLSDLHAGDTVYITTAADHGATPVAATIRKGPMTVAELRRRYLQADH